MIRQKIKHYLEYIPIVAVLNLLRLMPYRFGVEFGALLGMVAWKVFGIRRKVSLENLRRCFPDKFSEEELENIALRSYKNFGRSMLEYALVRKLRNRKIEKYIKIENFDKFDRVIGEGKGCIGVTGHFGSWELMGAMLSHTWPGYIDFLVGEQHNILVDNLMNKNRHIMGINTIKMGVAARGVLASMRKGCMVAMLSDQDSGDDGVIVKFFGLPASTPKGPAAFALKAKKPLTSGFVIREKGPYHRFICCDPIEIVATGNKEEDIRTLTQRYTEILEKYIRLYPDQWFWAHRRFKSTVS